MDFRYRSKVIKTHTILSKQSTKVSKHDTKRVQKRSVSRLPSLTFGRRVALALAPRPIRARSEAKKGLIRGARGQILERQIDVSGSAFAKATADKFKNGRRRHPAASGVAFGYAVTSPRRAQVGFPEKTGGGRVAPTAAGPMAADLGCAV